MLQLREHPDSFRKSEAACIMSEENLPQRYSRIIQEMGQLPTMPTIAAKVMQLVNDPNSSAEDIAKFISKDLALTSKVLRLANSAFYGIPRTISSVNSAIVILGYNTVRSLVLSASVVKLFPGRSDKTGFDRKSFWKHSFMVGMTSRMLAQMYRRKKMVDVEIAFSAGLLHDVGKLILEQFAGEDYLPVIAEARKQGVPLYQLEKSMLGLTHADISAMLIEKWQMPNELREPIQFHHLPSDAGEHVDVALLIHTANFLCHKKGIGCMDEEPFGPLHPDAEKLLADLGPTLEEIEADMDKQLEEAEPFFALIEAD